LNILSSFKYNDNYSVTGISATTIRMGACLKGLHGPVPKQEIHNRFYNNSRHVVCLTSIKSGNALIPGDNGFSACALPGISFSSQFRYGNFEDLYVRDNKQPAWHMPAMLLVAFYRDIQKHYGPVKNYNSFDTDFPGIWVSLNGVHARPAKVPG
jgi:hypothetical protein